MRKKAKWDKIAHDSNRAGAYYQHISFFFEPIPKDIIASVFNNEHKVWRSGNVLYEHQVKISDLGEFAFELVESPEVTELFYNPKYDKYVDKRWYELVHHTLETNKYIGNTSEELIVAINKKQR